jgi:2-methylfumaryl-CoA hydratase
VFGKSVADISLNAVANLGYADGHVLAPVYPGTTLRAQSEVIGKRDLSSGKAGVVWVRTRGIAMDDDGSERDVLRFCRWVMVERREPLAGPSREAPMVPSLPAQVAAEDLVLPRGLHARDAAAWAWAFGQPASWDSFAVGGTIDHEVGMTIDEADHTSATRLWQNDARVHFDAHAMAGSRFGKRLVYGGHIISLAWALAANGLGGALAILAINSGSHLAPSFAGDTIYAWSEILDKRVIPGRDDLGVLRLRLCACKNVHPAAGAIKRRVPGEGGKDAPHPAMVLEYDIWVAIAR